MQKGLLHLIKLPLYCVDFGKPFECPERSPWVVMEIVFSTRFDYILIHDTGLIEPLLVENAISQSVAESKNPRVA